VREVIVVKLDRLTRRTRDLLFLVEDVFQAHDIALHIFATPLRSVTIVPLAGIVSGRWTPMR
jgi:hypothetical protein